MNKEQKETKKEIEKNNNQDARTQASEETNATTETTTTIEETKAADTPNVEESIESAKQEKDVASAEQEDALALEKVFESEEDEHKLSEILDSEKEQDEPSEEFLQEIKQIKKDQRKITALRKCLTGAFMNYSDVRTFCEDYLLDEILYLLPDNAPLNELVQTIIAYCKTRECLDTLYEFLAKERPNKYTSCNDKYELFDSINRIKQSKRQAGPVKPHTEEEQGSKEHPLTQNEEKIRKWFFNDLDQDEQSFVITVALFKRTDRQRIYELSNEIKDQLFKKVDEESNGQTVEYNQSESADESIPNALTMEEKQDVEKQDETIPKSNLKDEFDLLQRVNVKVVMDTRYTEHGQTQIQTLAFAEPDQRGKVLRLLKQSLNNWLPELYKYLFKLGNSSNADDRRCAVLAVAELMCKLSFVDLTRKVLSPWAKKTRYADRLVSETLALVVLDAYHQQEALNLLRHWISVNNSSLNSIALLTYLRVGLSHPDETMAVMKKILDKKPRRFVVQLVISGIVRNIYALYPELVIEYLHEWIVDSDPKQEETLRYIASCLFLDIVRLSDIPLDDVHNTRGNVVDLIFTLWASVNMPHRSEIQRDTTNLVKRWAEEAIDAQLFEPVLFTTYHRLFTDLDKEYARREKENRFKFYLSQWGLYDRVLTVP